MIYKLNPQLKLITSPVILEAEREEKSYGSGEELTRLEFEKNYIVESISARDGGVVVALKEIEQIHNITWVGEDAVNFT